MIDADMDGTVRASNLAKGDAIDLGWSTPFCKIVEATGFCLFLSSVTVSLVVLLITMLFMAFSLLLAITEAASPGEVSVLTQFFFKFKARWVDLPTTLTPLI